MKALDPDWIPIRIRIRIGLQPTDPKHWTQKSMRVPETIRIPGLIHIDQAADLACCERDVFVSCINEIKKNMKRQNIDKITL
jgi:hypothetical protein